MILIKKQSPREIPKNRLSSLAIILAGAIVTTYQSLMFTFS